MKKKTDTHTQNRHVVLSTEHVVQIYLRRYTILLYDFEITASNVKDACSVNLYNKAFRYFECNT